MTSYPTKTMYFQAHYMLNSKNVFILQNLLILKRIISIPETNTDNKFIRHNFHIRTMTDPSELFRIRSEKHLKDLHSVTCIRAYFMVTTVRISSLTYFFSFSIHYILSSHIRSFFFNSENNSPSSNY